jgi:NADPH-dependent 2,4-dienoyl-CoA reductase/sulfur reductase-like enzyme
VGTEVSKVFDLQVARTGLTEEAARAAGYPVAAAKIKAESMSRYYPGVTPIHVKLIFDESNNRLLGGQIIGQQGAAKRIDVLATALHQRMTIDDIRALDLSYAPPFAPVWDPILVAANVAAKE